MTGQGFVYRAYGVQEDLLYIGSSKNVTRRMTQHRRTSPWYPLMDHLVIEEFDTIEAARAAEREAIRTEYPAYNKDGRVPTAEELEAERRELAAWARAQVATWPPLTDTQRDLIARSLGGTAVAKMSTERASKRVTRLAQTRIGPDAITKAIVAEVEGNPQLMRAMLCEVLPCYVRSRLGAARRTPITYEDLVDGGVSDPVTTDVADSSTDAPEEPPVTPWVSKKSKRIHDAYAALMATEPGQDSAMS